MPTESDGSTPRYCWTPAGMTRAADLPGATLQNLIIAAANVALVNEEVVAVLGASNDGTGHFCRRACRLTHSGSVLVMSDLGVIAMYANSGPSVLAQLSFVAGKDGRSVAICAVQ